MSDVARRGERWTDGARRGGARGLRRHREGCRARAAAWQHDPMTRCAGAALPAARCGIRGGGRREGSCRGGAMANGVIREWGRRDGVPA